MPEKVFANLTKLSTLHLNNNKLKVLYPDQFRGLHKLAELFLSENNLQDLPEGIFKDLSNLKTIRLNNNGILRVTTNNFDDLPDLRFLFMHDNMMNELPIGFFKNMKYLIRATLDTNMMCCHLKKEDADCISTIVENFASCENMLKNPTPRYSIWVIGVLSLLGAVCVLLLRHFVKEKNVVQVIMLMHLAVADGLMGVYLLTIAVIDRLWSGEYYLHDFQWRFGLSCQITGAISVLSSEVSAMLLTLISADRFKNIVFPYRGRALTRRKAHILCMVVWIVGLTIAFLPISGIHYFKDLLGRPEYYSRSVVCLPLQLSARFPRGWEYSVAIFTGLNSLLITLMIAAYITIFLKSFLSNRRLARQGTGREIKARAKNPAAKRETALAKRFAFIIFTDCACWMPIIVVGITFLVKKDFYPTGDLPVWMAVFVLPINSALNPIIYTLSTPKFQDFISPKLRKVIDFLRARFTRRENQDNQQDQREGDHENVEMIVINAQDPEQESGEGNREMVEMEVPDIQVPERTKQDEGMAGTLHVVVVEVSAQAKRLALVPREADQGMRLPLLPGQADLGQGNSEMAETEVLDAQGPEQAQEEQIQILLGEADGDERISGPVQVVAVEAQDQAEEESREECQPGPDKHSLDPSRDGLDVGCDDDKSGCDRLQPETDQASFPDEALEYDTKL